MLVKMKLKAKRCQRCSSTSHIMTDMSEHLGEQTRQNEERGGRTGQCTGEGNTEEKYVVSPLAH